MGAATTYGLAPMGGPFTGKVSTDSWYPILMTDVTDNKTQETSITDGNFVITYTKIDGSSTTGSYSPAGAQLYEAAEGLYGVQMGASEWASAGMYVVTVSEGTPATNKYVFAVEVTAATLDDLVRSSTPANALDVDSNGRVDVGEWLGSAVTLDSNNLPDVNVAAISDDTDAADSLEGAIDNSNDVIAANTTYISGDSTAADNLEAAYDGTGYAGGTIKQTVNVVSWAGTTVTLSSTTSKPEVDAYSISDNSTAADNVQANIGNLDAAISTRSAPGTAQTIDFTTSLPGSPTADTVGNALVNANDNLDAAVSSRSSLARSDLFENDVKLENDADGYVKVSDGTGTGQIQLTSGAVDINLAQSYSEGQTGQTVGGSLEITEARFRNKYDSGAADGTETIYESDGSTPLATRTNSGGERSTPKIRT